MLVKNTKDIGQLIRQLRLNKKLSGPKFADKLPTGQAMLSRIENGKANITLATLLKVAAALGKKLHISFK